MLNRTSKSNSQGCSNSAANGPLASSGIKAVLHGWFCNCQWCLQGIR